MSRIKFGILLNLHSTNKCLRKEQNRQWPAGKKDNLEEKCLCWFHSLVRCEWKEWLAAERKKNLQKEQNIRKLQKKKHINIPCQRSTVFLVYWVYLYFTVAEYYKLEIENLVFLFSHTAQHYNHFNGFLKIHFYQSIPKKERKD